MKWIYDTKFIKRTAKITELIDAPLYLFNENDFLLPWITSQATEVTAKDQFTPRQNLYSVAWQFTRKLNFESFLSLEIHYTLDIQSKCVIQFLLPICNSKSTSHNCWSYLPDGRLMTWSYDLEPSLCTAETEWSAGRTEIHTGGTSINLTLLSFNSTFLVCLESIKCVLCRLQMFDFLVVWFFQWFRGSFLYLCGQKPDVWSKPDQKPSAITPCPPKAKKNSLI